jgi:crotonobetainyl-CoA:carnitine CoA-transferase CaiB-like acyl-CoA transferase
MLLGDLGADVITVERPDTGDDTRGWGPPFDERGESAYFLSVNRNKKSVAVDLARAEDRALIAALVADADLAVDNFKRGTLERYDLSPARFLAQYPALVWCTITGFGPESDRPGYDYVVQAERGWMSITGVADGAPMKVGVALADVVAGKDAAVAALAALAARYRDGRGRHVVTSLAQSATAALVNVAQNVLISGRDAPRWGNAHPNLVPYELFEAADRAMVIAVGNDAQWRACAQALGLDELAADPRLATNAGRLEHREELVLALGERLREAPAANWLARLARAGVPAGVVQSVLEALREVEASPLTGVGPSVPGEVRAPPPLLDEHGAQVRRPGWGAFDAAPPDPS